MIEMSWWFFWLTIILTVAVAAFMSYWIGVDRGETKTFLRHAEQRERQSQRIHELSMDKIRLIRELEQARSDAFYPENVWNNARIVPDKPQ